VREIRRFYAGVGITGRRGMGTDGGRPTIATAPERPRREKHRSFLVDTDERGSPDDRRDSARLLAIALEVVRKTGSPLKHPFATH